MRQPKRKKEIKMAKILDCGLIRTHDRKLGINHKNIAKELTIDNWNNKARTKDTQSRCVYESCY